MRRGTKYSEYVCNSAVHTAGMDFRAVPRIVVIMKIVPLGVDADSDGTCLGCYVG